MGKLFSGGKFTIGSFSAEFERNSSSGENQLLKDQIISILTNIIKSSDDFGGVLIIIDEIHNLSDLKGAAHLMRSIATTLDVNGCGKISFMIIGYSDTVKELFAEDPSAKRHFDSVPLEVMPLPEAVEVLTKGFEEIEIKYDRKDVEQCIIPTGGYPHSIQLLGHNVVSLDEDNDLSTEDWNNAITRTSVELQSVTFSDFYNFNGKQTLRETLMDVLAIVGKPISKKRCW